MKRYCLRASLLAAVLMLAGCAQMSRDSIDDQAAARANARLGLDFFSKRQYEEAQAKFKRALDYDGDNVAANWGMALLYQALGEPQKARSYYQHIMGRNRVGPKILNSYGAFLCDQGETDAAMQYFEQAAANHFNDFPGTALANAGLCQEHGGNSRAAEKYYRRALAVDGDQLTALTKMAQIQYTEDQYLSARAFIERADAVGDLTPDLLLLAARIELALGDADAARLYVQRHNRRKPSAAKSIEQLRRSS